MSFTIGVLGGMGPLATNYFLRQLLTKVQAERDQDYPNIVLSSHAKTPDRSAYLMGEGPSPVPALVHQLAWLSQEADIIAMPCNTAHAFHGLLQGRCPVPILHMPSICVEHLSKSNVYDVLLLGTEGTLYGNIYQGLLRDRGIKCSIPPHTLQEQVNNAIQTIKRGGYPDDDFFAAIDDFADELDCDRILLGCTELSIVCEEFDFPTTDPTNQLATVAVRSAAEASIKYDAAAR